jgi:hypothetical protein
MERGERPIAHGIHMAVLDRIEVDVIDMSPQIDIVADRMFPVAPLPDPSLAAHTPDR